MFSFKSSSNWRNTSSMLPVSTFWLRIGSVTSTPSMPEKLHIRSWNPALGIPSEAQERTPGRRAIREQPQRLKLLIQRTLVGIQNILGDDVGQVVCLDVTEVKRLDSGIQSRTLIKGPLPGAPTLAQALLFFGSGETHGRADPDPDTPLVAYRRTP